MKAAQLDGAMKKGSSVLISPVYWKMQRRRVLIAAEQ
jgi:hypothetical protein